MLEKNKGKEEFFNAEERGIILIWHFFDHPGSSAEGHAFLASVPFLSRDLTSHHRRRQSPNHHHRRRQSPNHPLLHYPQVPNRPLSQILSFFSYPVLQLVFSHTFSQR